MTGYKNVLTQKELQIKMSSLLNVSNGSSKPEDKNNGISIIAKNNEEEEYLYISICGPHGYRRHKTRVWLIRNQGSALFADGDTQNANVTYNFWREHGLIIVDSVDHRPKHFRLDIINQEQLLALNDM